MMAVTTLHGPDEVGGALGRHLGHSDWLTITQVHINRFAEATSLDGRADAGAAATVPDFFVLSLSNLVRSQSPHRSASRIPARRAMRSSSAGHA